MTFFRPLKETAPDYDPSLPWPLHGLAYIAMFVGSFTGGAVIGLFAGGLVGCAIGVVVGASVYAANGLLFDRYIEAYLAKMQRSTRPLRILVNIAGFAWAIAISALSTYLTLLIMYKVGVPSINSWIARPFD